MSQQSAMTIATILIVGLNGIWYAAKIFLNARGVRVHWFSRHFDDLAGLRELADRSTDHAEQTRARTLLWALRGGIATFLLVGVPLFFWGATGRWGW